MALAYCRHAIKFSCFLVTFQVVAEVDLREDVEIECLEAM